METTTEKRIVLGIGTSVYWPYQSGKTTESGMTLAQAMLKAGELDYPAKDVKFESDEPEEDCDMASYPNGGGTNITTKTTYYVLEK